MALPTFRRDYDSVYPNQLLMFKLSLFETNDFSISQKDTTDYIYRNQIYQ